MKHNQFEVAIILDSTQDAQFSLQIASWMQTFASQKEEICYEVVDIKEYHLASIDALKDLDGPVRLKNTVERFDAFVFITQEYNHYVAASLKNALLITKSSWYKKVAGIIAYGSSDGTRAITHLKNAMEEVKLTSVRMEVSLSLFKDFENEGIFQPRDSQTQQLIILSNQISTWGKAARSLR